MLKRLTNGEFVLAMLVASIFWIAVLAWATSYAPTDPEKEACYHAVEKSGRSTEECKSFWERTTSDPVAMFTLVLAVSTVGLWSATILLYGTGEKQIGISSQVADVAEKQLAIIGLQTDIQRKQHAIGRLQFIAAHRPLLRVRYFKLLSAGTEPIQIAFTVANVGTGTARLLGSRVAVEFFSPTALPTPFYLGGEDITGTRKFEPGATDEYRVGRWGDREYAELMWSQRAKQLYIYGVLTYADDNDGTRTTAFCRGWNADRDRFDLVDDADYEYED